MKNVYRIKNVSQKKINTRKISVVVSACTIAKSIEHAWNNQLRDSGWMSYSLAWANDHNDDHRNNHACHKRVGYLQRWFLQRWLQWVSSKTMLSQRQSMVINTTTTRNGTLTTSVQWYKSISIMPRTSMKCDTIFKKTNQCYGLIKHQRVVCTV